MKQLLLKIFGILSLFLVSGFAIAQESYNNCNNALELCPNYTFTVNNIGANATVCPNCEDDFNFCFSGKNTIWLKLTTNEDGGDLNVNFSNLVFQNQAGQGNGLQAALIKADLPCISSSYSLISNCENNQQGNFSLTATNLPPNTTYYIVINGTMGTTSYAEATFDVSMNGPAVNRQAQFFINSHSTTICRGNSVVFEINTLGCEDRSQINWFVNNELALITEDFAVFPELQDNDEVQAQISCFDQCRDTLMSNSLTFTVLDFPVDAGPDLFMISGSSVQLEGYTTESIISWEPSENINNPLIIQPVVSPEETTTYFLTVSNGICSITDEMIVFVDNSLEIPNMFTPNGDGINDTWDILGIEQFPNCHVEVFTRWGQLVYQTTGYNKDKRWDGNTKAGNAVTEGAYYYVINLRDPNYEKPLKGTVSIVR